MKNLRTLDLGGLHDLPSLPEALMELKNLKKIILPAYSTRYQVPEWSHNLTGLEILSIFVGDFLSYKSELRGHINLINYFDDLSGPELCSFIKLLWKYKKMNLEDSNNFKKLLTTLETEFSREIFRKILALSAK
ncbi:MAG: hypothetical protein GF311_15895 [Candidatus Lokiarchaeota archaeon]|nr:hypothetical protein [Candidatus Lokiarchaeota archaeon]